MMKRCKRCGELFFVKPHLATKQEYCGSKSKKNGCSRAMALERMKAANSKPNRRKQIHELCKAWRKRQRSINGPDAIRQRAMSKQYRLANLERVKEMNKQWRKANKSRLTHNNKQRRLLIKALGTVSWSEWMDIKTRYKFRCSICGIHESELDIKWAGTQFTKLTMDHIIPISNRGKNIAENIQPLCISCNARKHDRIDYRPAVVLDSEQALSEWRHKQFGTVVATNGCFDLLHVGHLRYLKHSKELGSSLIVGVNSDRAVRQLKGVERPLTPEQDRLYILSAFKCVDAVICIDSTNVSGFLKSVSPDIWTKGGDYSEETLDKEEVAVAKAIGARIIIIPRIGDYSTTSLHKKLQEQHK